MDLAPAGFAATPDLPLLAPRAPHGFPQRPFPEGAGPEGRQGLPGIHPALAPGPEPLNHIRSGPAGHRVETDTYALVYLAFGLEAIDSAETRREVMSRALEWLATRGTLILGQVEFQGNMEGFGAMVYVTCEDFQTTTVTEADGAFMVRSLPGGTCDVEVRAPGHIPARKEALSVPVGSVIELPPVRLLAGDLNGDGRDDSQDLALLASNLGKAESPWPDPPPPPPPPGLSGTIAFTTDRDGDFEIYLMGADGSDPVNLTNSPATWDTLPDWSPDGARIVFMSSGDGQYDVYAINADGSDLTRLTDSLGRDWYPAWSPDGARIVFASDRDRSMEIYVMNADGTGLTRLTEDDAFDRSPDWSPDGSRIVFASDVSGDYEVYVMNADGTGADKLTNSPGTDFFPRWSPNGESIVFDSRRDGDREIYVMNADGTGQTNLTNHPAEDGLAEWSPDGTSIAFASDRDGDYEVYVMNADGTGLTRITENGALDCCASWSGEEVPPFLGQAAGPQRELEGSPAPRPEGGLRGLPPELLGLE